MSSSGSDHLDCANTLRRLKIDSRLKSTNCVLFYGIFHDFSTLAVCRQSNQDRRIRTIGSNYSNFRFFTFVKCFCKIVLTFENVWERETSRHCICLFKTWDYLKIKHPLPQLHQGLIKNETSVSFAIIYAWWYAVT